MPNIVLTISNYSPKSSDSFFFDNNIWMYLFCPLGNYNKDVKQRKYSSFLSNLLSRRLHIYTSSLILSEFANRYLRLHFDLLRSNPKTSAQFSNFKKDYMGSKEFQSTIKDINIHIKKIANICQKSSDEFNSIQIEEVLDTMTNTGFNDSYYFHLAVKKNWIIVSDDSDFANKNLPDKNIIILKT